MSRHVDRRQDIARYGLLRGSLFTWPKGPFSSCRYQSSARILLALSAARRRRLTCLMEQETDVINVRPRPVQCPSDPRAPLLSASQPRSASSSEMSADQPYAAATAASRASWHRRAPAGGRCSRFVRGRVSPAAASRAAPRPPRVSQAPHASVSEGASRRRHARSEQVLEPIPHSADRSSTPRIPRLVMTSAGDHPQPAVSPAAKGEPAGPADLLQCRWPLRLRRLASTR